jgi:hypothetical protein
MPECGFNNLEQGILIACAIAATGCVFMATLAIMSASLRSIDIAHHLRRIAEAMEARD